MWPFQIFTNNIFKSFVNEFFSSVGSRYSKLVELMTLSTQVTVGNAQCVLNGILEIFNWSPKTFCSSVNFV